MRTVLVTGIGGLTPRSITGIIRENHLTCMMITHNMRDAITYGNRLIMMNEGRIILDIAGEEKKQLTKRDLLDRFAALAGTQEETDAVLLS